MSAYKFGDYLLYFFISWGSNKLKVTFRYTRIKKSLDLLAGVLRVQLRRIY